jgi:hypothetical protein
VEQDKQRWGGWKWIAILVGFAGGFAFSTFIGCHGG